MINSLSLSGFQFLFAECDEWNACYLCTTISFKEFTSNVAADGNKTQRYETVPVTLFKFSRDLWVEFIYNLLFLCHQLLVPW